MRLAQERGLSLTGPEGLLKQFTKNVLEKARPEGYETATTQQPTPTATS